MTQLFADDQTASALRDLPLPRPALAPAMTAGKGVRAVRCIGCRQDTLPRPDDGAPLCAHCCEVLAGTAAGVFGRVGRWRRRRP